MLCHVGSPGMQPPPLPTPPESQTPEREGQANTLRAVLGQAPPKAKANLQQRMPPPPPATTSLWRNPGTAPTNTLEGGEQYEMPAGLTPDQEEMRDTQEAEQARLLAAPALGDAGQRAFGLSAPPNGAADPQGDDNIATITLGHATPGYLLFKYPPEVRRPDRVAFEHYELVATYSPLAAELGITMIPDKFGGDPAYGVTYYGAYEELAIFAAEYPEIVIVNGEGGEATLQVAVRRSFIEVPAAALPTGPTYAPQQHRRVAPGLQGFVEVFMRDSVTSREGLTFSEREVTEFQDIKKVIRDWGLRTTNENHNEMKGPAGEGGKMTRMGADFRLGKVSMDVTTRDPTSPLTDISFPSHVRFQKRVIIADQARVIEVTLEYRVGGEAFIDQARLPKRPDQPTPLVICGSKMGCKQKFQLCGGACLRAVKDRAQHNQQVAQLLLANPHLDWKQAQIKLRSDRAMDRVDQSRSAATYVTQGGVGSKRKLDPCAHLMQGRCVMAKNCRFGHLGTEEDWAAIPCDLRLRNAGGTVCKAGRKCIYKHDCKKDSSHPSTLPCCTVLHCTVLHCPATYRTVLFWTALCRTNVRCCVNPPSTLSIPPPPLPIPPSPSANTTSAVPIPPPTLPIPPPYRAALHHSVAVYAVMYCIAPVWLAPAPPQYPA